MIPKNLQHFIKVLSAEGELHRVGAEVDPALEITEIVDRVSKAGGPALLFETVKGSDYPLLINAFGSYRRMELVFGGSRFAEIAARLEKQMKMRPPEGMKEKNPHAFFLKGDGRLSSTKNQACPLPAAGIHRRSPSGYAPRAYLLARRRRPLYHPAACGDKGSGDRCSEPGYVPHAQV